MKVNYHDKHECYSLLIYRQSPYLYTTILCSEPNRQSPIHVWMMQLATVLSRIVESSIFTRNGSNFYLHLLVSNPVCWSGYTFNYNTGSSSQHSLAFTTYRSAFQKLSCRIRFRNVSSCCDRLAHIIVIIYVTGIERMLSARSMLPIYIVLHFLSGFSTPTTVSNILSFFRESIFFLLHG